MMKSSIKLSLLWSQAVENVKSEFLKIMLERGFFHQSSHIEGLDALLSQGKPITSYNGYDPTGASLHAGHLLPVMIQRWYQKTGHKPIVLLGGATSLICDPSGKDEMRKALTRDDIAQNIKTIKGVFQKYLSFGNGTTDAIIVNNSDWLEKIGYIEMLSSYGHHFTINRMLTFDSVRLRLEREQPLTFLEFNYMILQAYDFLHLYKHYDCPVQTGGSDQWGNIINGVELIRRVLAKEAFAFTCPLLTTASGKKMGKSAGGAVWLNDDMYAPYDFYQYWRNVDDADVVKLLKLYTELPMDEIARLAQLKGADLNEAKKILAFETTKLCHGLEATLSAQDTARKTFEEGTLGDNLPVIILNAAELNRGIPIVELLKQADMAASNGEARRLIDGGGARLNDEKITDWQMLVTPAHFKGQGEAKLSAGKKKHAILKQA
jgi:tyrosyl-tRNA synthetase